MEPLTTGKALLTTMACEAVVTEEQTPRKMPRPETAMFSEETPTRKPKQTMAMAEVTINDVFWLRKK